MGAANCAAVLLSVPISYHFHGCTALLVALVVVSGAISNTHLYLYLLLKIALTRSIFQPKCTKYRLAAGLRPDPLGEFTALPHTP